MDVDLEMDAATGGYKMTVHYCSGPPKIVELPCCGETITPCCDEEVANTLYFTIPMLWPYIVGDGNGPADDDAARTTIQYVHVEYDPASRKWLGSTLCGESTITVEWYCNNLPEPATGWILRVECDGVPFVDDYFVAPGAIQCSPFFYDFGTSSPLVYDTANSDAYHCCGKTTYDPFYMYWLSMYMHHIIVSDVPFS